MSRDEIEFVYFDLGNMLISFDPETACNNVVQRYGIEARQVRAAIFESGLQDRFEHGEVSGDQFAESVRADLGISKDQMPTPGLLEAISDMFVPIESMREIILRTSRDRRIGILSNTCHAHWEWIVAQEWPVMDGDFEIEILSFRIGAMKPDPRIFAAAEAAAGVAPSRILFLDDRAENVQGAIDRGWQAAQCVGGTPAANVLRQFGVLS